MFMESNDGLHLPEQKSGSKIDAVQSKALHTIQEAEIWYKTSCQKLLNVNGWYKYAELPISSFKLFDSSGRAVQRPAIAGDLIRIDIPGPGPRAGEGYDWVAVESILEENAHEWSVTSLTVRPSGHPFHKEEGTAHFLTDQATATFQVKRTGNTVYVEHHGRNEVPNTGTAKTLDNIRNTLVGWSAKIGFSYPQWKSLVTGLLNNAE
jgi:hypothetical protein